MAKGRAGASRVSGAEVVGVTSITLPTPSPSPEHAVAMPIANTRTANVPPARAHRRRRDRCHALAHTVIQVTDGRLGVRVSRVAGRGGGVGVRRGVAGCCCCGVGFRCGEITGMGRPGAPARGAVATGPGPWTARPPHPAFGAGPCETPSTAGTAHLSVAERPPGGVRP